MGNIDSEKFHKAIHKWMSKSLAELKRQAKRRHIYLYSHMPKQALARALALLDVQGLDESPSAS